MATKKRARKAAKRRSAPKRSAAKRRSAPKRAHSGGGR